MCSASAAAATRTALIEGGLGHFYATKYAKGVNTTLNSPVASIGHE